MLCSWLNDELAFNATDSKSLLAEFQPLKSKLVRVAKGKHVAASFLAELEDHSDEGNFTGLYFA